jgi:PPOX class probable F420-dependent enzyme
MLATNLLRTLGRETGMEFTQTQRDFLSKHRAAAMTTLRADGSPHTVRVGCVLMGDALWSSGTRERLRTRNLRRDPRANLMVFDSRGGFVTVESTVRLLEGDDVPELSIRMFRAMQNQEDAPADAPLAFGTRTMSPEEFREFIVENHRLLYEFEPVRVYGSV